MQAADDAGVQLKGILLVRGRRILEEKTPGDPLRSIRKLLAVRALRDVEVTPAPFVTPAMRMLAGTGIVAALEKRTGLNRPSAISSLSAPNLLGRMGNSLRSPVTGMPTIGRIGGLR